MDWTGPPDLCVEHYDSKVDGLSPEERPPDPGPRWTRGQHVADELGAETVRREYPSLTYKEAISLMAFARTGAANLAAWETGVTAQTLKNHMSSVYRKLEVNGIVQAMYRLFGTEVQMFRRGEEVHTLLLHYLRDEWLDEALRNAAAAAMEAAVETIDLHLYKNGGSYSPPLPKRTDRERTVAH